VPQAASAHQLEVLWGRHRRLDLPGVVQALTETLASLARQGLAPDAVLIEDAAPDSPGRR